MFVKKQNNGKLRIIPLGGLEQIGMNITAFEYYCGGLRIGIPGGRHVGNRSGDPGCDLFER